MSIAAKLREWGREEGREEGLEKGRVEGIEEGKIRIAKKMFLQGMTFDAVQAITELSDDILRKIQGPQTT